MFVETEKDSGREEWTDDKVGAYVTLYNVLVNLVKVSAPFVPFITDEIYQNLVVRLR